MKTQTQYPGPGVFRGIDPQEYHRHGFNADQPADSILSKSLLWDFMANPHVFRNGERREGTGAMVWGSLVDCLLLTPEHLSKWFAWHPLEYSNSPERVKLTTDFPGGEWNGRTKECKEWKAEQEAAGFAVITPEQAETVSQKKPWNWNATTCKEWRDRLDKRQEIVSVDTLLAAKEAVRVLESDWRVAPMLEGADKQAAVRVDALDARIKALIDIAPAAGGEFGNALVDLKTTGRMESQRQLENHAAGFGYHVQGALYLDAWNAATGEARDSFWFVFQESSPPYDVAVLELDRDALLEGRRWYQRAVDRFNKCAESDTWPSAWEGLGKLELPSWAYGKREA